MCLYSLSLVFIIKLYMHMIFCCCVYTSQHNGTISNVNVVENINSSAPIVAKVCYDMTQVTKWIQMA